MGATKRDFVFEDLIGFRASSPQQLASFDFSPVVRQCYFADALKLKINFRYRIEPMKKRLEQGCGRWDQRPAGDGRLPLRNSLVPHSPTELRR
jgi:hypothetical protein